MKRTALTIVLLLFSISGFAQQEPCEERLDSVKKVTLNSAQFMSELIADYPAAEYNKIIDYVAIEIATTCNGKAVTYSSTSDALTPEQKSMLKAADIGSKIRINIKFSYKDSKNDNLGSGRKVKEMAYTLKASTKGYTGLKPCGC